MQTEVRRPTQGVISRGRFERGRTEWIKANHSYDVPEVVTLPVLGGRPKYLSWVSAETRAD